MQSQIESMSFNIKIKFSFARQSGHSVGIEPARCKLRFRTRQYLRRGVLWVNKNMSKNIQSLS